MVCGSECSSEDTPVAVETAQGKLHPGVCVCVHGICSVEKIMYSVYWLELQSKEQRAKHEVYTCQIYPVWLGWAWVSPVPLGGSAAILSLYICICMCTLSAWVNWPCTTYKCKAGSLEVQRSLYVLYTGSYVQQVGFTYAHPTMSSIYYMYMAMSHLHVQT
jgi:hypothetical protein